MKNTILLLLSTLAFQLNFTNAIAQEALSAGGGSAIEESGSVNYTIGQVFFCTYSGVGGIVAEGVQQPYEIYVYSGIEDIDSDFPDCKVFPNPVDDILTILVGKSSKLLLTYQLFDSNGKLLKKNELLHNETEIPLKKLATGTYFLKIISGENELKSFKIIKH